MAIRRRSGSSWVTPNRIQRRSGSSWVDIQTIRRRSGSSWITVYTAYQSIILTGSGINDTVYGFGNPPWTLTTAKRLEVTASQGTGNFSYSWSRVSGSSNLSILPSDASLPNPRIQVSNTSIARHQAVFRCTVSDGVSSQTIDLDADILVQMST